MQRSFAEIYAQATAAMTRGEFARALPLYEQAIALDPTHAEAHYKRGNALRLLGRADAAIASYDEAIKHKPDNTKTKNNQNTKQHTTNKHTTTKKNNKQTNTKTPTNKVAHYN